MVKMIFCDFDKTIIDRKSEFKDFSEYQLSILRKLMDRGIMFSLVTGRSVSFFIDEYVYLLDYVSYIIGSNGGCIYDVNNKKYIYSSFIGESDIKTLIGLAIKYDINKIYFNLLDKRKLIEKDNFKYFNLYDALTEQIVLLGKNTNFDALFLELKRVDSLDVNNYGIDESGNYFFDVNKAGVSKGNSVSLLCDYLGGVLSDAIAFGDSENDISMLEVVGKGICVGNASDMVKKVSNSVIDTVWADGVFHHIEENIL